MIVDRNRAENNVKSITQNRIPNEYYNPAFYLTPFSDAHKARSLSTARVGAKMGPTINSIHAAKVHMQKENINEAAEKRAVQSMTTLASTNNSCQSANALTK